MRETRLNGSEGEVPSDAPFPPLSILPAVTECNTNACVTLEAV
jgi:hypothetical protein